MLIVSLDFTWLSAIHLIIYRPPTMITSISGVANLAAMDGSSQPLLIGGFIIVAILLILWRAGALTYVSDLSLGLFKSVNLKMRFHKRGATAVAPDSFPIPAEKPLKNRSARKRQTKQLTDVAGLKNEIGSVLTERKKKLTQLPANYEETQLEAGFAKLEAGKIIEAKKYFDSVLQRNPKSADGCYGLARVLEIWKDIPNALKYYWEATRVGDATSPRVILAQAKLDELSRLERQQNTAHEVIKNGHGPRSFWFEHVPNAKNLARYFVALSNSEEGGTILIGIDKSARKPSGNSLSDWEQILDAVRRNYVTAPCITEVITPEHPRCVLVIVQRGLNRPYRLNDDDGAKVFVPDGVGDVREALPEEIDELRKKKRG
jgi:tetratricopeptide (TPR) repeat protein